MVCINGAQTTNRSWSFQECAAYARLRCLDQVCVCRMLEHPAFRWNHLKADKMLGVQKGRVSFKRKTAHTFAQDDLGGISRSAKDCPNSRPSAKVECAHATR
jgi:hypothetical protein